jgi:hypothetical protein
MGSSDGTRGGSLRQLDARERERQGDLPLFRSWTDATISSMAQEAEKPKMVSPFMSYSVNVNPTSEHELYLKLFITNSGGW